MSPIPLGILAASGVEVVAGDPYELLQSEVLSGSSLNVTFSNVDSYSTTYDHLQLRITARTDRASTLDDIQIQLNGDTGSNYSYHTLQGAGTNGISSGGGATQVRMPVAYVTGASNDANAFGIGAITLLDAFNTSKNKTIKSIAGTVDPNWALINLWSGAWYNTNAISSIKLFSSQGTNYVSGSRFSLYGMRGL